MNRITADAHNLRDILNQKYTVQYYQREYRWETKQVEELIDDLILEFGDFYKNGDVQVSVKKYGDYFLGPIILTSDNEIIDGQQRLTTLTLLLIYLNHLQSNKPNKLNVDSLIFSEMYGEKTFSINVPERTECLISLFEKGEYELNGEHSESVKNIYFRYTDIIDIFPEQYKSEALPVFIEWLIDNVYLVKITTDSEQDAHKVFVTMNDRGLRLTPTEMLKGYLLSEIEADNIRNKANDVWKHQVLKLKESVKEGDADFIKDWLRARYAETIREAKKDSENKDFDIIGTTFHKWVRENKSRINLQKGEDYERFILKEFKMYSDIFNRLVEYSKTYHKEYEYVFYNADRGFTFQYQIILAAINPEDSQEIVNTKIKMVSCFIDQFITIRVFNFRTMDYSSIKYTVFNITKMLRQKNIEGLMNILQKYLQEMEINLEGIDYFYLNMYTTRYMRHILARMTYYLESECGVNSSFYSYVDREQKNPYDIEHIWANDYSQANHSEEFATEEEFDAFRNKFGGLLLLPKDKNRSFQDMEYSEKVQKYYSENLLAKTLNSRCYENNPLFITFINNYKVQFKPYAKFNKADLLERQAQYKQLCKVIWDIKLIERLAK